MRKSTKIQASWIRSLIVPLPTNRSLQAAVLRNLSWYCFHPSLIWTVAATSRQCCFLSLHCTPLSFWWVRNLHCLLWRRIPCWWVAWWWSSPSCRVRSWSCWRSTPLPLPSSRTTSQLLLYFLVYLALTCSLWWGKNRHWWVSQGPGRCSCLFPKDCWRSQIKLCISTALWS